MSDKLYKQLTSTLEDYKDFRAEAQDLISLLDEILELDNLRNTKLVRESKDILDMAHRMPTVMESEVVDVMHEMKKKWNKSVVK